MNLQPVNIPRRRILHKIILLFGLLIVAIISNAVYSSFRENKNTRQRTYEDLQTKLHMISSIQNHEVEKLGIISGIVMEQGQRFCDFIDYDNIPPITFMLNTIARIHDIDLAFIFNEDGILLTTYPKGTEFKKASVYRDSISDKRERVGVEKISAAIVAEQLPAFMLRSIDAQILCFKSVVHLIHDTGDIYGYVVLAKIINKNKKLVNQMADVAEAEVIYYDQDHNTVLASFLESKIPYPAENLIAFQGRSYFSVIKNITDFEDKTIGQLAVALDKKPFLERQRQLLLDSLMPFVVSIIISFILFYFLNSRVFYKINQLIGVLRSVSKTEGDLSLRLEVPLEKIKDNNLDEVEYMAAHFNHMMDKLEETYHQLIKAQKEAELASIAKSEFLANMSHEIRTPMNAVLGFLELVLEDASLSANQRKKLMTAHIAANSLLVLINDILDVSKLESGKLTIEYHPFNLLRLMQEIYQTMVVIAGEKGLDLQLDIQPSIEGVFLGDSLRLRQIIVNLVNNAIKFTDRGSVSMRVMPAKEKDQLHFIIEDTGIGIPTDRLSQIFEPFTQADTTTTRRFGGTGLGTTIARELVELMGGRIWAESEEGKGSTFHFSIKLASTDQVPKEADPLVAPNKAVLTGVMRKLKILLVEDNKANVKLAKIRLEQQGHSVTVAWNGHEAIEAFKRGGIDIILMDIQMPVMGGTEATERIRALEADTGEHVPIIAMTAGVMREEREKYIEVGMDAIVAKPIAIEKLFKTMETLISEGVGEMVTGGQEGIRVPSGLKLPPLDGVDTKKGLETWQNLKAYTSELLGFSKDYGNAATDLEHLINEGDIDGAFRMAHTLKGVAGNLSVPKVADAAIHIDAALREKRIYDVKDKLTILDAELKTAVDSIRQLEAVHDTEKKPQREMDVTYLKELFIKMLPAFDQFSPSAVEPFLSELKGYLSQDQIAPIVAHIERFDFAEAKQETVKLAEILKINLKV